jgi:ferritin heavy chain
LNTESFAKDIFNGIDFIDMKDACVKATEEQIKKEVTASMKYLSMAAFFARDDVNRPGFAKLFFEAAGEEREHAYKLIEYLSMRGRYLSSQDLKPTKFEFDIGALVRNAEDATILGETNIVKLDAEGEKQGLTALQNALKLEVAVTKSIRSLVETCEKQFNHYHVSFLNF